MIVTVRIEGRCEPAITLPSMNVLGFSPCKKRPVFGGKIERRLTSQKQGGEESKGSVQKSGGETEKTNTNGLHMV